MDTEPVSPDESLQEAGSALSISYCLSSFDIGPLRDADPDWYDRPTPERVERARTAALEGEISRRTQIGTNATSEALHREIARLLTIESAADFERLGDPPVAVAIGVGDTAPSTDDRELDNKVGQIRLTDPSTDGPVFTCAEEIGSLQFRQYNGEDRPTLKEWGVQCASGRLRNRGLFSEPIERSTDVNHQLLIRIPIGDVSQVRNGVIAR